VDALRRTAHAQSFSLVQTRVSVTLITFYRNVPLGNTPCYIIVISSISVVKIYRALDIRTARPIQIYSLKRAGSPETVLKNPRTRKVKAATKGTSKKYRTHRLCSQNSCHWAETGECRGGVRCCSGGARDSEFCWHFSFRPYRLDSKTRVQSVLNGFTPYSGRLNHNYSLNTNNGKSHDPGGNNGNNPSIDVLYNLIIMFASDLARARLERNKKNVCFTCPYI